MPQCFTCGKSITFDKNIVSQSGKMIPLNPDKSKHSHNPQQGQSYGQSQQTFSKTINTPTLEMDYQQQGTPTDVPKKTYSGPVLDTKRVLQVLMELYKHSQEFQNEIRVTLNRLEKKIEDNVTIDSARYENQMKMIYEVLSPFLNTQKTAAQLLAEEKNQDPAFTNHSKRADDYIEFVKGSGKPTSSTKFVDESKEKISLDERIPDNFDEMQGAIDDNSNEGVIDETYD